MASAGMLEHQAKKGVGCSSAGLHSSKRLRNTMSQLFQESTCMQRWGYHGQVIPCWPLQAERLWKRYLEQDDSPVTDFFGGQLQNNVTCHVCKHRFTSYEFFKVGL